MKLNNSPLLTLANIETNIRNFTLMFMGWIIFIFFLKIIDLADGFEKSINKVLSGFFYLANNLFGKV